MEKFKFATCNPSASGGLVPQLPAGSALKAPIVTFYYFTISQYLFREKLILQEKNILYQKGPEGSDPKSMS